MVTKALSSDLFFSVHDEYLWDQHDDRLIDDVSLSKTTQNLTADSASFSFSLLQLCMQGTLRYRGTRGTRGYQFGRA